jgi:hypothetical protein
MVASGIYILHVGWRKWPDVYADYGSELYPTWQISQGGLLYRDLYYMYGPLSCYVHALLFKVFGTGIMTLVYFNLLLTVLLTVLIYDFFRKTTDKNTAFLTAFSFVTLFAFSQHMCVSIFNFLCPYTYASTHGVFLSILSVWLFLKYLKTRQLFLIKMIGFISGLVFLTKIEVSAAYFIYISTAFCVLLIENNEEKEYVRKLICNYVPYFLIPILIFVTYYAFHTNIFDALKALFFPYTLVFNPGLQKMSAFSKNIFGLKDIPGAINEKVSIQRIVKPVSFYLGLLVSLKLVDVIDNNLRFGNACKERLKRYVFYTGGFFLFYYLGYVFFRGNEWKTMLTWLLPVPYILILFVVYGGSKLKNIVKNTSDYNNLMASIVFAAFSVALTFRIFFCVHIITYGFAFAMPATLVLIAIVAYWLPKYVLKVRNLVLIQSAVFGILISLILVSFHITKFNYDLKTSRMGSGKDLVYIYPSSVEGGWIMGNSAMREALLYVESVAKKDETLAVFPQAPILNYLSRRKNPSPYYQNVPIDFALYGGDDTLIKALALHPPDYVLCTTENRFYELFDFFGSDYGVRTYAWVKDHYYLVRTIGDTSYRKFSFGMFVYKRKPDLFRN